MKKKIFLFLNLILMFFLASCNGFAELRLEIKGIAGVTDADINLDESTVKFSVSSEISTFDVSNILVPADVEVKAYSDVAHSVSLGQTLNLVEGENVFYLKLSSVILQDEWTLHITRLSSTTKSPKSISVKHLDEVYNLNDQLSSGVLLVTYNDDTTEEVLITPDMVTGFDTKMYGERELIISFRGLVTTFNYRVVRRIVEINVSEDWIHDYLVGAEDIYPGGVLNLVLDNGSIEKVDITENMVSNFYTSNAGQNDLVITYKGMTTKFRYVVHSAYTEVKIENLKTSYRYGEQLQGKIKFVLGDYIFTKPLKDFAEGYDAYTPGEQTITVSKYGLVAKVVVQEGDNFVAPTQSTIEFSKVKEVYAIIYAIGNTGRFQGEKFEKSYNKAIEQELDENDQEAALKVIRRCGVTAEQVDKIIALYRNDAAPLLDSYAAKVEDKSINSTLELFSEITSEDISKVQEILGEILEIISPNQITVFLNETQGGYREYNYSIPVISEDKEVEYVEYENYIKLIEAAGLTELADFMKSMEEADNNVTLSLGDINYIVEIAYSLIDAVTKVEAADIYDILSYVVNAYSEDFQLDKNELLTIVHSVADIFEEVLIDTGLLYDYERVFTEVADKSYINGSGYNGYVLTRNIVKLVTMYGADIISIAQNLTLDELEIIVDLISSIDSELTEKEIAEYTVDILKIFKPIVVDINSDDESKEMIADIFSRFASDKNVYSTISKMVSWTTYSSNNLTEEQITEINNSMKLLFEGKEYIAVSKSYDDAVITVGSSITELLAELNSKYRLRYIDVDGNETPIQLTESSVKGLNTTNKGWHTVTVSQQGTTVKLYYYVFDPTVEGEITYIKNDYISEVLLYFGLGTNTPDANVNRKEYIKGNHYWGSDSLENVIYNVTYRYFIKNAGISSSKYIDIKNVEYVVDTTTVGLKYGYIKYKTMFGDILVPFQCYVYDLENPMLDTDDIVIYIEQYCEYYKELYLSIDFQRKTEQVAIIIEGESTQELGTFKQTFEGFEFTFIVVDGKELNQIKKVTSFTMTVDASNPENTYKLGNFSFNYIRKNSNNYYCYNYEDLINHLNGIYDQPSVSFEWGDYTDVTEGNRYVDVPYTIYDGDQIVYEGIAGVNVVSSERFYDYYYNIYRYDNGVLIVDSYGDVTIEKLLENVEIYKCYYYLENSQKELTLSEFLNEAIVTFDLEEEFEYYRNYTIEYSKNSDDYPNNMQVKVVLTKNKDIVVLRSLEFSSMKFINSPTDEEVVEEIHKRVALNVYTVSGGHNRITGQEAIDFLNSCNPYYNIEIDGNNMSIRIECEIDGESKTYYTYASIYTVNETTNVYPSYRTEFDINSLEKEHIFEQLLYNNYEFWFETASNGQSFWLYSHDMDIKYFEIITDLTDKVNGDRFELECTYHGAKMSFVVTYYSYE